MAGVIEFYKECTKNNIKPLLGSEVYVTEDPDDTDKKTRDNYHLVLITKSLKGLENLIWLSTQSQLHNFYYKPRVWRKHLETHSEGLIATSACLGSHLSKILRWEPSVRKVFLDDRHQYLHLIHWFQEVFKGEYYLEIQDHDFWEQKIYNEFLINLARKEKLPLVITSDAHYLKKEDSYLHEMMMAMQFKKTLEEYRDSDFMKYGGGNYILSQNEMLAAAKKWDVEDALDNTIKIADQCDVKIEFGNYKMPFFKIEETEDYEEFKKWQKK